MRWGRASVFCLFVIDVIFLGQGGRRQLPRGLCRQEANQHRDGGIDLRFRSGTRGGKGGNACHAVTMAGRGRTV